MARKPELRLHEQMMLLALRDEKGTLESRTGGLGFALGGALLAELMLEGCISVTEDKKKLVTFEKEKRFYDDVLDEAMLKIQTAKRRRAASAWVSALAGLPKLRHRVAERLCRAGILQDSEDTVLLIFKRKVYPTIDPAPEARLIAELREAVLSNNDELPPRTSVLATLADVTGMLKIPFTSKELRPRRKRLKSLAKGEHVGAATREAVAAAEAAIATQAAVTAAVTAATTAASS